MKLLAQTLFVFLWVGYAWGFDPAGPPPKKTVEWTSNHICNVIIPSIEFSHDTSLAEGLEFLQGRLWIPKEYGIKIDGNALGAKKLKMPIQLQAENISLIKALSLIADMFQAKLVIGAGIVTLKPDAKLAEQNGVDQAAARPQL